METKRLLFTSDVYYGKDLAYKGGQTAEVPIDMVQRWLRRGAVEVDETKTNVEFPKELEIEENTKKIEDNLKSVKTEKRNFNKKR